jgi:methyl-accepting chemotaxis protein
LKIAPKIFLSFGSILLLTSIVFGFSFYGLEKIDSSLSQYNELSSDSNLSSNLESNMLMVRMNVKDYLITQSDKDLKQYHDYFDKTKRLLNSAETEINKPERASLLKETIQLISVYQDSFEKVVQLSKQHTVIENNSLAPKGEDMRLVIDNILTSANEDNDARAVFYASRVQKEVLVGRLYVVKFLQSNIENDYKKALDFMNGKLRSSIITLDAELQNSERRKLLSDFKKAHESYTESMKEVYSLIEQKNNLIKNKLDAIGPRVAKNLDDMKLSVIRDQKEIGEKVTSNVLSSETITLTIAIIAIILGLILAYVLTGAITRAIRKALSAAKQISQGDLIVNVEGGKDEIGDLLNAIQHTSNTLNNVISKGKSSADIVSIKQTESISAVNLGMENALHSLSAVEQIATASTELSSTATDVADSAQKAEQAAKDASNTISDSRLVIEKSRKTTTLITDSILESQKTINELREHTENINSVIDVINTISEQTNLLALNAAIEAARAGDLGRGFAVVADEVRALAAKTQKSTIDIQAIITQLQEQSQKADESMQVNVELMETTVKDSQQLVQSFDVISKYVDNISDVNAIVATASEEQSAVTFDISKQLEDVNSQVKENIQVMEKIVSSSGEVKVVTEELKKEFDFFKV